uniref:Uncharacterized protein n=1 Tax=Molossus molossus TaxID=27622 RepID=A0A7J8CYR8_MOLMO|nr:hypothetical protein HJG59_009436 [Molossus molossus]
MQVVSKDAKGLSDSWEAAGNSPGKHEMMKRGTLPVVTNSRCVKCPGFFSFRVDFVLFQHTETRTTSWFLPSSAGVTFSASRVIRNKACAAGRSRGHSVWRVPWPTERCCSCAVSPTLSWGRLGILLNAAW